MRNGISAMSATENFTIQSAIPSDTQSGYSAPTVISGAVSHAQDISSLAAPEKMVTLAEKAIVKNRAVSRIDPTTVEASGARHH